jgi:S-phase kinase-associated protein 1
MHDSAAVSSKKINLISSDGEVFEVNYDVAVMSKTLKDAIETNSAGDTNSISLSLVKSEMLTKVIEYCKKHSSTQMQDVDHIDWDAKFVEVDRATLFGLVLCANYLNIKGLLDLVCGKVADTIKGMSPSEIRRFFDIEEEYNN